MNYLHGLRSVLNITDVYVYPVRREEYEESRYGHWWQGWLAWYGWNQPWVDDGGIPHPRPIRRGPRLRNLYREERHWDSNGIDDWWWTTREFCGWNELLRPTNTRYRDVEERQPKRATVENITPYALQISTVVWNKTLPAGNYHQANVRDRDGVLLWQTSLNGVHEVKGLDSLTVTGMGMGIS